jgi:hypothetical protein
MSKQVYNFNFGHCDLFAPRLSGFPPGGIKRSGLKAINSLYLNNPGFMVFIKRFHPMGFVEYSES